jgi:deoxyribonuclease-4
MSLIIGSHVSFTNKEQLVGSVNESIGYGSNTFMFYTGGPQSTVRSEINDDLTYEAFKLMLENGIDANNVIVHAPYILNLANRLDERKHEFYIDFFADELNRVKRLGFNKIVLHPGSATGFSREEGLKNIIYALNKVFDKTSDTIVLLETMAGKGNELGINIKEIKEIIEGIKDKNRIGVCLDTCHLNDAGYKLDNFDKLL